MVLQEARSSGVPMIRFLSASRTVPGPEDVDKLIGPILDGLTRPLTKEEREHGKWLPPGQQRVFFEGTIEEAQSFYQQTQYVGQPVNANICKYTDGFPIIVPTEERVAEMLKGTSHKPDEIVAHKQEITLRWGVKMKVGDPVAFQQGVQSSRKLATVEKVAINAVMAGCKPEHLPVALAISESGCGTGTTNFPSQAVCLSGPVVKELGVNTGCGHLGPGSPVNGPIGRVFQMMAINLSGAIPGVNRMGCHGSPLNNGGMCFAENADGLPEGWVGLNEEFGYGKDESIVMVMLNIGGGIVGSQVSPGGYRAFQKSGHGGMARRFNVKGVPGPHNWLEYIVPAMWAAREGGYTFIMIPEMAQHLRDYGFKTKEDVYDWLYKQSFVTVKDYKGRSWPDYMGTNGWTAIEKTSGKPWRELPDDYKVPLVNEQDANLIIVAGGQEEASVQLGGGPGPTFSIDKWR